MSAVRKPDNDAFQRASEIARRVRGEVAVQLQDLVIEAERMGSAGELASKVRRVGEVQREIAQAQGRQQQARELGLPVTPAVMAEREAWKMLRSTVMSLGAACGLWAAAIDFEELRRMDSSINGGGGSSDG